MRPISTVRGRWRYLYRAIDRDGALVDVMLSEHRDLAAAKAFFRSAKTVTGVTPDRVTTDGHDAYLRAIRTEVAIGSIGSTESFPGLGRRRFSSTALLSSNALGIEAWSAVPRHWTFRKRPGLRAGRLLFGPVSPTTRASL
jgi:DDE domain